ncbi:MAG: GTP 3',8-cyclase MoaA [Planctomycetota bacterium]|nr:GTP 3',8-cyclase MoaA [Planctomycetota bacterium]
MQANAPAAALSLRISVTGRCQLRCRYCAPAGGDREPLRADALAFDEILAFVRILKRRYGLRKVHLTGGEPLLRPGIARLVRMLTEEGLADLALTTNGHRLAGMAGDLRRAGLRRINVSLDSLDPQTYRRLTCGGDVARAVAGIEAALLAGLEPVKLNMVVLRGINEHEVVDMVRWGLGRGCQVRLLELMPIGAARRDFAERFVPSAEVQEQLAAHLRLRPLPYEPGASSRNFLARDTSGRAGVIGFISPCSEAFCDHCRRLRLTADGRLLGCLAQPQGTDIRGLLAPGAAGQVEDPPWRETHRANALVRAVEEALSFKRSGRRFAEQRHMISIGG